MSQGARHVRRSEGLPKAARRLALFLGVLGPLSACSSDDKIELEVFSWWDRPSERQAFEAVRLLHESAHPDVVISNQAVKAAMEQRERMASLVLSKAPPATFTANIGADLLRWATVDQTGDAPDYSYVKDVSGLLTRTGLLPALPDPLKKALAVGPSPELYGVPINIHRLNLIYYNVEQMERLSAERGGENLLTLEHLCPESGVPDLPESTRIAIGQDYFALILLTFESVLPAIAGADFYDALFRGEAPDSVTVPGETYHADVRRALACVHGLSRFFHRPDDMTWARMLYDVSLGQATFTVMGDWANGELARYLEDGTVGVMPFPGTERTFVFTSDTFPLPIGVKNEPEVVSFLETIASPPAQRLFSSIKGSIPARRDVDGVSFASESATDFDNPDVKKVLATSGRFPPYYRQSDLGEKLRNLTAKNASESTIDEALVEFDSQEPLFFRFQERLRKGSADPRP